MFGELPDGKKTPPPPDDHPEIDTTELSEDDEIEKCTSLSG